MGIEDRDYYRQNYAKKQGMRYNTSDASYEYVEQPQEVRAPPRKPPEVMVSVALPPRRSPVVGSDWHWSLKLLLWLVIAICLLIFLKLVKPHA